MPYYIGRAEIEMTIQTPKAEESCAFVTASAFPFWMINSAKVAKTSDRALFRFNQVIDSCAKRLPSVRHLRLFWFESQDLSCANQNPAARLLWYNFCP